MKRHIHLILTILIIALGVFAVPTSVRATDTDEEVAESRKSADNSLDKLSISDAELSPTFYYSTVKYTATVPYEVTEVDVTARTSNAKASIESISGYENLVVGENTIKIVVVAENGNKATYTIKVTRLAEGESVGGNASGEGETSGESGEQAETSAGEENPGELKINLGDSYFVFAEAPQEVIPSYTSGVDLEIEGIGRIRAFQYLDGTVTSSLDEADFYLVYGVNEDGEYGWYQYDQKNGIFQRYNARTIVQTVEADNSELLNNYNTANAEVKQLKQKIRLMTYVFLFIVAILLIIMFSILWAKRNDDYEDGDVFEEEPAAKAARSKTFEKQRTLEDPIIFEKAKEEEHFAEPEELNDFGEELSEEIRKTKKGKVKRKDSLLAYLGLDDDLPLDYGDVIEGEDEDSSGETVEAESVAENKKASGRAKNEPVRDNQKESDIEFIDL